MRPLVTSQSHRRRRVRLSVTSPPGRRGTKPPASLRGTMENASTGQMCSSNPPPGCGGVAPGPAGPGLGPGRTERRSLCFGSIRTAQSRYGSRTGSHAQFIYMMWWQSARVTQRRDCRGQVAPRECGQAAPYAREQRVYTNGLKHAQAMDFLNLCTLMVSPLVQ